jgi:hypothetical protein
VFGSNELIEREAKVPWHVFKEGVRDNGVLNSNHVFSSTVAWLAAHLLQNAEDDSHVNLFCR